MKSLSTVSGALNICESASQRDEVTKDFSIVFVCRANRCRSPLAERLTQLRAAERGLTITTSSMGFLAAGFRTPAVGVRAAAEYGLNLSDHRSRQLDLDRLLRADLILTSARAEARDLVAVNPKLWPRVFTLKQFPSHVSAHPMIAGEDFASWIAASGDLRRRSVLLGDSVEDDVADPMGRPLRIWRKTLQELDTIVERVLFTCARGLSMSKALD